MSVSNDQFSIFGQNIRRFLRLESAAGLVLLAAAALAMIVKNSPMAELYMMFLNVVGEVRIGSLAVEKPLFLWVNDGFMADRNQARNAGRLPGGQSPADIAGSRGLCRHIGACT
jgi:hypothetical protein